MPQGDPAGYLPNVKKQRGRVRKKKGRVRSRQMTMRGTPDDPETTGDDPFKAFNAPWGGTKRMEPPRRFYPTA